MAWSVKYQGYFYNIENAEITIQILADGYSGSLLPLRIRSVQIIYNWDDYLNPIVGCGCEFEIINENDDWNYYEELLIAYEREFKVKVLYTHSASSEFDDMVVFEGFLLSDVQEQKVLPHAAIRLKASNYLQQLEFQNSIPAFDSSSTWAMKDFVGQALVKTGLSYDMFVNCSLYETQMYYPIIMSYLYLQKHLFREGEEYMDLKQVLTEILKPFNMYVYSWNEKWYVERYSDMFIDGVAKTLRQYSLSSWENAWATEDNDVITANVDFKYTETSQTLQYGRGYKKLTIKCISKNGHNLVNECFTDAESMAYNTHYGNITEGYWERWKYDNQCTLTVTAPDMVKINNSTGDRWRGIYTKLTLMPGEVTFNFSCRRQLLDSEIVNMNDSNLTYTGTGFGVHILYGSSWQYKLEIGSDVWEQQSLDYTDISWAPSLTPIKFDEGGGYYYAEIDISITLEGLNLGVSHDLEFRMASSFSEWDNGTAFPDEIWDESPTYRNIRITQSVDTEDIIIEGTISENYSEKVDIDIRLFDIVGNDDWWASPYYGANGMMATGGYQMYALPTFTRAWLDNRTEDSSPTRDLSLQKHLLEDIFQYYQRGRKKLITTLKYPHPLKPFSIIRDPHITRNGTVVDFLLLKYTWDLDSMIYEIEADEYVRDGGLLIPPTGFGSADDPPPDLLPPVVTGLYAHQPIPGGHIDISWTAITGVTGYKLYRKPFYSGGWVDEWYGVYTGATNSFEDNIQVDSPPDFTNVEYYVVAYNDYGDGQMSEVEEELYRD